MQNSKQALRGIGRKMKDEARDLIVAKLPERLEELLRQLRHAEQERQPFDPCHTR